MDVDATLWAEYRRLLREGGLTLRDEAVARQGPDLAAESRVSATTEGFTEEEAEEIAAAVTTWNGPTLSFTPMLQRFAEQVRANARCLGIPADQPFLVAEYPTGELNACVAAAPSGALILINFGLLMMVFQVAKIQSLGLNFCRSDGEGNEIPGSEFGAPGFTIDQTTAALASTVYAYLSCRDSTQAIRFPMLVGERLSALAGLVHHSERFIVAHELAHLFCDHLEDAGYRDVYIPGGGAIKAYEYLRERELSADALALRCCMYDVEWPSGRMASWIAAGAAFTLGIETLVGKVLSLHVPPAAGEMLRDHPPADERIAALRSDVFTKYGGAKAWNRAENLLLWLDCYADEVVRQTRDLLRSSEE